MEVQSTPLARCPIHGVEHRRTDACPECVSAPTGLPEFDYESHPEAKAREDKYRARADVLWEQYEEQIELADWHSHNVAAKMSDCAVKWERLAEEVAEKRRAREHDLKLIRHERDMSGRGRAH